MKAVEHFEQEIVRDAAVLLSSFTSGKRAVEAQRIRVSAFIARHADGADALQADHPLVPIMQKMRSELEPLKPAAKI